MIREHQTNALTILPHLNLLVSVFNPFFPMRTVDERIKPKRVICRLGLSHYMKTDFLVS